MTPSPEARAIQELAAARRRHGGGDPADGASGDRPDGPAPRRGGGEKVRAWIAQEPERLATDQVTWFHLAGLLEHDPERGQAAWRGLKAEARTDLRTGFRVGRSLEIPVTGRPVERAQVAVVMEALRQALAPKDVLEELLVQQMASAYELNLRWQALVVRRMETEVGRGSGTGGGRWRG